MLKSFHQVRPKPPAFLPSPPGRGAGGEGGGGGESRKPPVPSDMLKHARSLRSKQTDAEQLLWGLL